MASIRKRGASYLIVVSMGYDHTGKRLKSQQKTVKPPAALTKKQTEKWLSEQATLFEMECKSAAPVVDRKTTLAQYTELWLREIAPDKMAKSTLIREKQDIARFLPELGHCKLTELRPDIFRKFYARLRKTGCEQTGKPLSGVRRSLIHSASGVCVSAPKAPNPQSPSSFQNRTRSVGLRFCAL